MWFSEGCPVRLVTPRRRETRQTSLSFRWLTLPSFVVVVGPPTGLVQRKNGASGRETFALGRSHGEGRGCDPRCAGACMSQCPTTEARRGLARDVVTRGLRHEPNMRRATNVVRTAKRWFQRRASPGRNETLALESRETSTRPPRDWQSDRVTHAGRPRVQPARLPRRAQGLRRQEGPDHGPARRVHALLIRVPGPRLRLWPVWTSSFRRRRRELMGRIPHRSRRAPN